MASSTVRRASVAALAFSIALSVPARAAAAPDERITALVAGATVLHGLRGNTVVTFDAAGREIARCARFGPPLPSRRPAPRVGPIDPQEVLRQAGLPDDDFRAPEAEDLLAAEGLTPRRPARTAADGPIVVHALAASSVADDVWIATSAGLYRGRHGACARVALAGRDVIAVSAAGDAVAAATTDLLWRSADRGGTFQIAAGLNGRTRALAAVDGARTLVADHDGVVEIGADGTARVVVAGRGDALAVCGSGAVAFVADGVWAWNGTAAAQRVGARPPARVIGCGDGHAARFLAVGDALFASADGSVWRERPARAGHAFATTAFGNQIWIATEDGVMVLDDRPTACAASVATPPPLPALSPLPTRRLLEPAMPWPQLAIVFTAERTAFREGWSLVAFVVFRMERTTAPAERSRVAAELVQRDAALAAQEIELATAPDDDPSRSARLRALRQEREALR